jgi:hypothetical protein
VLAALLEGKQPSAAVTTSTTTTGTGTGSSAASGTSKSSGVKREVGGLLMSVLVGGVVGLLGL